MKRFCLGLKDKTGKLIYQGDTVMFKKERYCVCYEISSASYVLSCWDHYYGFEKIKAKDMRIVKTKGERL